MGEFSLQGGKIMSTKTAIILSRTYAIIRTDTSKQDDHYTCVYRSYYYDLRQPEPRNMTSSTANRRITGKRIIPKQIIRYYADPRHPHCPPLLYADILAYIQTGYCRASQRTQLLSVLLDVVDLLPSADRPYIVTIDTTAPITEADLATLWTRTMWYCMIADHIQSATIAQSA